MGTIKDDIKRIIKWMKPDFDKIRFDINYKKEGFTQYFPILRIKNDKEIAWIFGFGKKNIAFVSGENDSYKEQQNKINNGDGLFPKSNTESRLFQSSKLNKKEKLILAVLAVGCVGMLYYVIRASKKIK